MKGKTKTKAVRARAALGDVVSIEFDPKEPEVVVIEGVRYSVALLKAWGEKGLPVGSVLRIAARESGELTLEKAPEIQLGLQTLQLRCDQLRRENVTLRSQAEDWQTEARRLRAEKALAESTPALPVSSARVSPGKAAPKAARK